MKVVIFGLSVSSSWGNGHATLWRGLIRALSAQGHQIVFFERDAVWYAGARDLVAPTYFRLNLYDSWRNAARSVQQALSDADAAIVTSFCPDGVSASRAVLESNVPAKVFYDLDAPVTLALRAAGAPVEWAPEDGYAGFDLVLSYSGGRTLDALRREMGAKSVVPLYGSADPEVHRPVPGAPSFSLSYLGTYAEDRQIALESLFIEPARRCSGKRFLLGGALYPQEFPWTNNIFFRSHVTPEEHNSFYCSAALTLNITRRPMLDYGHCPSGRLFEAAACGIASLSDRWDGLEEFFEPGREILVAGNSAEAISAILRDPGELSRIGRNARERALSCHTAAIRAAEMIRALDACMSRQTASAGGQS